MTIMINQLNLQMSKNNGCEAKSIHFYLLLCKHVAVGIFLEDTFSLV